MIESAYFRIYVPADPARPWHRYVEPESRRPVLLATDHFVWDEATQDDAIFAEWSGQGFVCPRFPKLRMLEGILAFATAYPGVGAMLLNESVVRRASDELDLIRSGAPEVRSHILTSPWHVPLRWFTAFDPAERELFQHRQHTCIRYRTVVSSARERLERSIEILREAGFDRDITDQVADLLEWLDGFPPNAMAELDYAGVATLFPEGALALDTSAEEIAASLAALTEGDYETAGERYADVASRWAAPQALMYAN
jgi:hypothetical protein